MCKVALSYAPTTDRNPFGKLRDRYLALPDVGPPFSGTPGRPTAD
jgi:hypothetical protein